jgi:hypothetical protein
MEQLVATRAPSAAEGPERVLVLSGRWRYGSQTYALESELQVNTTGQASGPIRWQAERLSGANGIEDVRGHVADGSVELGGVRADRGLVCDQYRITLTGDDRSGVFHGISRAFGSWQGQMDGRYEYRGPSGPVGAGRSEG